MPSDLVVDAIVLPPVVTAPCPTRVRVVVRNAGTDPAPYPFEVCVHIAAGAEEPFFPEYSRRLGRPGEGLGLFPGQTVTVDFEVAFPCRAQNWVMAEADCRRAVPGNLRSNPRMTLRVPAVVPVPWLFTDLRVGLQDSSGTILWDPSQLCTNLPVAVEVSVANRGCADAPASTTELTVTGVAGPIASVSWPTARLAPGASATFLHVFPLGGPGWEPRVTIQACADTGAAVAGQCDTSGLCASTALAVNPDSGSPNVSLTVEAPVVPGQTPKVSWSVLNDCSDLGTVTAEIFFGPDKLYGTPPAPIAPLGQAGEQHVALTVPASVAADLWKIGQHPLELRVTSPGAPGTTFKTTAQLQVNPEVPRSTWAWTAPVVPPPLPAAVSWRLPYSVIGSVTNSSAFAALTLSAITITEATAVAFPPPPPGATGVAPAGAMPVSAPAPVAPGAGTLLVSRSISQTWTWCDPTTFAVVGPPIVIFAYVATFTLTDQFGNAYPPTTSSPLDVEVRVSGFKRNAAHVASTCLLVAAALAVLAAAALASVVGAVLAAVLAAQSFALWGQAIWHKAMADDPPVPDFDYHERVEVRPVEHDLRREGAPPWGDAMATVIELLERVRASQEALTRIHPKLLGARIDGDAEALAMQAADYRAVLDRLQAAAEQVPNAIAQALPELEADEQLSAERVEAALDEWRTGKTLDEGRRLWRDNQLPEEAFDDLAERMPHFETLPPLGEALARISQQTVALAQALAEEGSEVLALAERP